MNPSYTAALLKYSKPAARLVVVPHADYPPLCDPLRKAGYDVQCLPNFLTRSRDPASFRREFAEGNFSIAGMPSPSSLLDIAERCIKCGAKSVSVLIPLTWLSEPKAADWNAKNKPKVLLTVADGMGWGWLIWSDERHSRGNSGSRVVKP